MQIEIIKGAPKPGQDYDVIVLIDVFRATSTISCMLANGIKKIDLASNFDDYLESAGYLGGLNVEYFSDTDHPCRTRDNSPITALDINTENVDRAVIVSKNGTKVPSWVNSCRRFLVCSLLNVHSVADYIKKLSPECVSIVAIGHIKVPEEAEEDNICAHALLELLQGRKLDEQAIRDALEARREETKNDPLAPQGRRIDSDRAFCCGISLFDVVPAIKQVESGFRIEPAQISLRNITSISSLTSEFCENLGSQLHELHQLLSDRDFTPVFEYRTVDKIIKCSSLDFSGGQGQLLALEFWGGEQFDLPIPIHRSFNKDVTGPVEVDLAFVVARLILSSDGSIHRAQNFMNDFMRGYGNDFRHEVFVPLTIEFLLYELNLRVIDGYFKENIEVCRRELVLARGESDVSLKGLVRRLCERSNNNGKLDGRIEAGNEIVYQKRDGNEISVNLTNRCPNACVFCIRDLSASWKTTGTVGGDNLYLASEPSCDEVVAAVSNVLNRTQDINGFVVKFCGYGEPLLRPDVIYDATAQLKLKFPGIRVQVNTSGWPFYKEYCAGAGFGFKEFSECGVDIFSVSLNAPNARLFNILNRPGVYETEDDAFAKTVEFIREVVEHGFETKASVVALPKLKEEDINECQKIVTEAGATLVVREFIGSKKSLSQEKFGVEVEAKIFGIERDSLKSVFEQKGAKKLSQGLVQIIAFDVPVEERKRVELAERIKLNLPEHRKLFLILKEVMKVIEVNATLAEGLAFLRIMKDEIGCRLIFRQPTSITAATKREKEVVVELDSVTSGIALLESIGLEAARWQEKCRESFEISDVRYHIDTWPGIDPYIEIEALDDVAIYRGVTEIGLDPSAMQGAHAENIFKSLSIDPTDLRFSEGELRSLGLDIR